MKRRIIFALLVANAALLAVHPTASPQTEIDEGRNCCKRTIEGPYFCCMNCCWFTKDCSKNSDC